MQKKLFCYFHIYYNLKYFRFRFDLCWSIIIIIFIIIIIIIKFF